MSAKNSGGNNTMAKKCEIEGVVFGALKIAVSELNISWHHLCKRLKSTDEEWKNWNYL